MRPVHMGREIDTDIVMMDSGNLSHLQHTVLYIYTLQHVVNYIARGAVKKAAIRSDIYLTCGWVHDYVFT